MADTYTTNLNLTKPEPGAAEDTWGISLNADLDSLDAIFSSSGTQINLNPNQVNFADNKKAIFGTGSDLQIYHSGSDGASYIKESGSGHLRIQGSELLLEATNGDNFFRGIENGSVRIYHDNAQKLVTTSSGISVTGTVTSDGLILDANTGLYSTDATLSNYASNNGVYLNGNIGGWLRLGADRTGQQRWDLFGNNGGGYARLLTDNKNRLNVANNGDISFYDDTGSTQGLFWDASAESLTIGGGNTTQQTLRVTGSHASALSTGFDNQVFKIANNSASKLSGIDIIAANSNSGAGTVARIGAFNTSSSGYLGDFTISTRDGSGMVERLRVKSDGKVGIGTDSPQDKLSIEGGDVSINNGSAFQVGGSISGNTVVGRLKNESGVLTLKGDSTRDVQFGSETNGTAMFIEGSNGNIGIGTSSPQELLHIFKQVHSAPLLLEIENDGYLSGASAGIKLSAKNTNGGVGYFQVENYQNNLRVLDDGTERMRIDSSGNVGIGTDSPTSYSDTTLHVSDPIGSTLKLSSDAQGNANTDGFDITFSGVTAFLNNRENGEMQFRTNNSEALRIDSSGNLLVGTTNTTPAFGTANGTAIRTGEMSHISRSGGTPLALNRAASDGDILSLRKDGTQVGSIASKDGDITIGTGDTGLRFNDAYDAIYGANSTTQVGRDASIDLGMSTQRFKDLHLSNQVWINGTSPNIRFTDSDTGADSQITASSGYGALVLKADYNNETAGSYLGFEVDGAEKGRIWSAGLLVGKTTGDFGSTAGSEYRTGGNSYITAASTQPLRLNRLNSDGKLLEFRKDGTTAGQINALSGDLAIGTGDTGLRFHDGTNSLFPVNTTTNANVDDSISIGHSTARFKDLHLSGSANVGTINNIAIKADETDFSDSILISTTGTTGTLSGSQNNTGLGNNVFIDLTTANNSTAIGESALANVTTGSNNTAIGSAALSDVTTTSGSTAVGVSALANNTASENTAIGKDAARVNTTGNKLVAVGFEALELNTTGTKNVAIGYQALSSNTTANHNTAVGNDSMVNNTTGFENNAVGKDSLRSNTDGDRNNGFGVEALRNNTTGGYNAAFGHQALRSNTTASDNTAVGSMSLFYNTTGGQNTAIGRQALYENTTASQNTAVGYQALKANTTGQRNIALGNYALQKNTTASDLVAIGYHALINNTTGGANVGVGKDALRLNATGSNNTALGYQALENNTGSDNTAFGKDALEANTTGEFNVAIGKDAATTNTTGVANIAVGANALKANTTASNNVAVGHATLADNTTGSSNVALGYNALSNNETGSFNIGIGREALVYNTTAGNNVGVGYQALLDNTTGASNIAVGNYALSNNTTSSSNIAIGHQTLQNNTTGFGNTAIGTNALRFNTTSSANAAFGYQALFNSTGQSNTALGYTALFANTSGSDNTAVGRNALVANTTGAYNVAVGKQALESITGGSSNTGLGKSAGDSITTGSNNACIGYQADTASATSTNSITLGDANITSLRCNTQTISALSDARDKANVEDLQLGVEFIKDLRPVSFTWERRDNTHNGVEDFGFIAQELDAVQEKHNEAERLGLVLKDNPERLEASYGKLVPMLVKAVQELSEEVESLKQKLGE